MFDVDKIVKFLSPFKNDLAKLYSWNPPLNGLVEKEIISEEELLEIEDAVNKFSKKERNFHQEIKLKSILHKKLIENVSNKSTFDKICLWIIKDWGGINGAKDASTIEKVRDFLHSDFSKYDRIASTSKVAAFRFPEDKIIYDSRVAYALNWIILSQNTGEKFFPMPEGRNSKMMAFDMNVLIRLKHIEKYKVQSIKELEPKLYINSIDKSVYLSKKEAYGELNNLIKQVNNALWKGDTEKEDKLFYTEMLLFSIADTEIFKDITNVVTFGFK